MQNVIEDVYTQIMKDNQEAALITVIKQHMTVIELFGSAEVQGCLDLDQYTTIKAELQAINKSLHALAEESHEARAAS